MTADVSDGAAVRRMVKSVVTAFGTVHILVNNAGVLRNTPVVDMPESEWDLVVDVCLKGAFLCSQAVLPVMMANRYGEIINISSLAARSASVLGGAAYTSARAGLFRSAGTWRERWPRLASTSTRSARAQRTRR